MARPPEETRIDPPFAGTMTAPAASVPGGGSWLEQMAVWDVGCPPSSARPPPFVVESETDKTLRDLNAGIAAIAPPFIRMHGQFLVGLMGAAGRVAGLKFCLP